MEFFLQEDLKIYNRNIYYEPCFFLREMLFGMRAIMIAVPQVATGKKKNHCIAIFEVYIHVLDSARKI